MNSEDCSITETSSSHLERGQKGKSCDFLHSDMIFIFDVRDRVQNGEIEIFGNLVRAYFSV